MSCSPLSWLLASLLRYEYSLGRASSSLGNDLEEEVNDLEARLLSNDEARSGIGSSGFEDCDNSGKNGLYGSGSSRSLEAKEDESVNCQYCWPLILDFN